jgi:hypothetical protein
VPTILNFVHVLFFEADITQLCPITHKLLKRAGQAFNNIAPRILYVESFLTIHANSLSNLLPSIRNNLPSCLVRIGHSDGNVEEPSPVVLKLLWLLIFRLLELEYFKSNAVAAGQPGNLDFLE